MQVSLDTRNSNPNFGLRIQNKSKVPNDIIIALKKSGLEDFIDKIYPHAKAEYKIKPDSIKFVISLGTHLKGYAKPYNNIVFKIYKYIKNEYAIATKIHNFNFEEFESGKKDAIKYMDYFNQIKNNKKIKRVLKKNS